MELLPVFILSRIINLSKVRRGVRLLLTGANFRMKREEFEAMGDRHKAFEIREAGRQLMPGLPAVIRLDGKAFHTFCRGLPKPFDERLSLAMRETTKALVNETHAAIGYTQSDEITLVFPNLDPSKKMMYDGKVQKLCSVLAGLASAKFNREIQARIPEKAHLLPVFDARAFNYPTMELALENLVWRETDATRNSLTMAASAFYSPKELHKAGFAKKHDMLHAKGINWNDYPPAFKRGTYIRRENILKELTPAELARIPEKHRPLGPVVRSVLAEIDMPPISRVANLYGVVVRGELPLELVLDTDEALS